jgi:23S rRNA (uracil1939-C5)-methyltransferase
MAELIELKIKKLVYGGEGLGHHDGRTVFVPFVLPEEVVIVDPVEQKKKFIRGRLARVAEASPRRGAAPCLYFGTCGGCDYQHIPYAAQLEYKAEILRETLSRLGGIRWEGPIATHGSPEYGYRNRAQWRAGRDAAGAAGIGYFESGSQRLCAIERCPIVSPRLNDTLAGLARLVRDGKLPGDLREAEAFVDDSDEKQLLNLSFEEAPASADKLQELLDREIDGLASILVHSQRKQTFELAGPGYLTYRVGDHAYRVGHLSFFQVNRFLLQKLVELVARESRGTLALDLFAGVGLFAVALAARFQRVVAVESNVAAVRDLGANLQESGTGGTAARETNVETFLAKWNETPDFVVVDPPRSGIAASTMARLAKLKPAEIGYLSCDPATLARDLGVLVGTTEKAGAYTIISIDLVDIFPQTYHMEALVRLVRRP